MIKAESHLNTKLIFSLLILIVFKSHTYEIDFSVKKGNIKTAKQLDSFFRSLKKGHVRSKDLRLTKNLVKKSDLFSHYNDWISDFSNIRRTNHLAKFSECRDRIIKQNHGEKAKIYRPLITHCKEVFIDLFSKSNDQNYIDHSDQFESYINFYLFPLKRNLLVFLDRISSSPEFHLYVSKEITERYKNRKLRLPPQILSRLVITTDLTEHIQNVGLHTNSSANAHKKHFAELINELKSRDSIWKLSTVSALSKIREIHHFYKQNDEFIPGPFAYKMFHRLGKRLLTQDLALPAELAFEIAHNTESGKEWGESIFWVLWPSLLNEKYNRTLELARVHKLSENLDRLDLKAKFWYSYALEKVNNKKLALLYYEDIIKQSPVNYYSIMSLKRIKSMKKNALEIKDKHLLSTSKEVEALPFAQFSKHVQESIKRIYLFSKVNQEDLLDYERRKLFSIPNNQLILNPETTISHELAKEKLTLYVAKVLSEESNYLKSFSIIYRALNNNSLESAKPLLQILFPTPYLGKIEKLADESVDPFIVLSLIRQESAFNPSAKSRVGARGLMQLMPRTAKSINRTISSRSLNNPNTNLRLGIKYFETLYSKYDENLVYTLAAYNAGESRVKRWKKEYFKNDSFLHIVESIPFEETNLYVKLIVRNLFFYKLLSGYRDDSAKSNQIFDVVLAKF